MDITKQEVLDVMNPMLDAMTELTPKLAGLCATLMKELRNAGFSREESLELLKGMNMTGTKK